MEAATAVRMDVLIERGRNSRHKFDDRHHVERSGNSATPARGEPASQSVQQQLVLYTMALIIKPQSPLQSILSVSIPGSDG